MNIPRKKPPKKKPRLVPVSCIHEQEAVQHGEWTDPIGGLISGVWHADPRDLRNFRRLYPCGCRS